MTETSLQARPNREEAIAKRRAAISKLIDGLYLDKDQNPPEEEVLTAMAARWDRHLTRNNCPMSRFNEVYDRAVDRYDNKSPFGIFHMLAAWDEIRAEAFGARQDRKCDLQHLDETEQLVEVVFFPGIELTLPCPNCRPEEFEQKRKEARV